MAWDPATACDGETAEDRARWCVQHCGLSEEQARERVMREYPAAFAASAPARWDPERICDGSRAADRARWCERHCGLSEAEARQRVMCEFAAEFGGGPAWDPDLLCDGARAEARAQWCMENCGLPRQAAQERVMREFPAVFAGGARPRWRADAVCDGAPAEKRAQWCVENCGLTMAAAQERVMREFPGQFGGAPSGGAVAALGCPSAAAAELVPVAPADPAWLVWADEFDYIGCPDPSKWAYDVGGHGWGNGELQHYTDRAENAWVSEGALRIRAVCEPFGGQEFTSARLVTKGRADWLYGRVEVRLKVPVARGAWAAAWMLPTDAGFGPWPKSGEIDIMEHVGHDVGKVHGTVHTERFNHMKSTQVGAVLPVDVAQWHTYAVEWSPDGIRFIMDDHRYHEFKNAGGWEAWPFDQRFHVLLNVAVGGSWGGQQGVDKEAFAGQGQVMEVSSVRVYRLR